MQPVEDNTSTVSRRAALASPLRPWPSAPLPPAPRRAWIIAIWTHSKMDHSGMDHAMHGSKHKALIDTASACIAKGEVCVAHCIDLIKGGDTAMADCMKSVSIMMPMCAALVRLAAMDAKRWKNSPLSARTSAPIAKPSARSMRRSMLFARRAWTAAPPASRNAKPSSTRNLPRLPAGSAERSWKALLTVGRRN